MNLFVKIIFKNKLFSTSQILFNNSFSCCYGFITIHEKKLHVYLQILQIFNAHSKHLDYSRSDYLNNTIIKRQLGTCPTHPTSCETLLISSKSAAFSLSNWNVSIVNSFSWFNTIKQFFTILILKCICIDLEFLSIQTHWCLSD